MGGAASARAARAVRIRDVECIVGGIVPDVVLEQGSIAEGREEISELVLSGRWARECY